ncbi:hypothetical protein Esti_004438 [Eimeria stiedai]
MCRSSRIRGGGRPTAPEQPQRSANSGTSNSNQQTRNSMARHVSSGGHGFSAAGSIPRASRGGNDTAIARSGTARVSESSGGGASGEATDIGVTFVPVAFQQFQNPQSPFKPLNIPFPPPTRIALPAVWSWQLTDTRWVPFDTQVSALIESLWVALQRQFEDHVEVSETEPELGEPVQRGGQGEGLHSVMEDVGQQQEQHSYSVEVQGSRRSPHRIFREPLSHKLYVYLPPWQYCIDLEKMLQQNTATQRVRPIRRATEPAAMWFIKGRDGYAHRLDQVIENLFEDVRREHIARAGSYPAHSPVAAWQQAGSSELHFTDVVAMRDTLGGRQETAREASHRYPCLMADIVRMEIAIPRPGAGLASSTSCGILPRLPSLSVGKEESGEAFCTGTLAPLLPEDCEVALLRVDANTIPEDSCAICLDSLRMAGSHSPSAERGQVEQQEGGLASSRKGVSSDEPLTSSDGGSTRNSPVAAATSNSCSCGEVVKMKGCPHCFHVECIRMYIKSSSKGGLYCPTCNLLQLPGIGPSPPGKMMWTITNRSMLSGHPTEGTIIINYIMEGGIQTERHAQPNTPYIGTRREAYLPDCLKGRQLLRLLIQAFVKGHLFTVGQSVTSGRTNVVVWNGIHHKTSVSGGVLQYGYPDDTFLSRLAEELRARGFCLNSEATCERRLAARLLVCCVRSPAQAADEATP